MAQQYRPDRTFQALRGTLSKALRLAALIEKHRLGKLTRQVRQRRCKAEGCEDPAQNHYRGFCTRCGRALKAIGALR